MPPVITATLLLVRCKRGCAALAEPFAFAKRTTLYPAQSVVTPNKWPPDQDQYLTATPH